MLPESPLGASVATKVLVSVPGSPENFIATHTGLFQVQQSGEGVDF